MNRFLTIALLLLLSGPAQANMVCRVTAGGGLAFGTYEVDNRSHRDSQMDLTVTCDRQGGPGDVTVLVRLSPGMNGLSVSGRRMARTALPADYLSYNLYRDIGRSSTWGATDTVDTLAQTLSIPNKDSRSATFTIYGRIPASQDVSAGTYTDSVQATVLY